MTEHEKMLVGAPHQPYDAALATMRQRCRDILWRYNTQTPPHDTAARAALLTELLGELPEGIHISAPFYCDYGRHIHIGKHFYSNVGCTILDGAPVHIGDNVLFAPHVGLYTVNHPRHPDLRRAAWEQALPITIGDDVWLCSGVIVLPGVTIDAGSVIGAGSVVAKDIPAGVIAVGNPCRVLRAINDADREQYAAWGIRAN